MKAKRGQQRRICFVTGTRAEFGLMRMTLRAIANDPKLELQLVVTGMHLDRRHGRSIDALREDGWTVDAVVPWKADKTGTSLHAQQTGHAIAALSRTYESLKSDIVLVVGDRVEAFAAAAAGHLSRRIVAHVHGGDRAAGEIDDSLRHAITKLSHIHFPATKRSAERIRKLGEDASRIHCVGSPGIDGITHAAASPDVLLKQFPTLKAGKFALLLLHPTHLNGKRESGRARLLLNAVRSAGLGQIVGIYPNNDPGSAEIVKVWEKRRGDFTYLLRDTRRDVFLALLRDCAVLVGNSSSGIIEAASFNTPVINIGDRQRGRERGANVVDVAFDAGIVREAIRRAIAKPRRRTGGKNIYGGNATGAAIARILAKARLDETLSAKLIAY